MAEKLEFPTHLTPALARALGTSDSGVIGFGYYLERQGYDLGSDFASRRAKILFYCVRLALEHGEAWETKLLEQLQKPARTMMLGPGHLW